MDVFYNKFKKAKFGGFDRKDVINYIEKVQNEFFQYQIETENKVKELNQKIETLQNLLSSSTEKTNAEDVKDINQAEKAEAIIPADEINIATGKLKSVADELCQSLSDFIEKLSESSVAVTINVPVEQITTPEDSKQAVNENEDKVQSILNSISSMYDKKDDNKSAEKIDVNLKGEKKSVSDILKNASFVC